MRKNPLAHVQAAARHGKHVMVEKPMALTLADCQAMIDAPYLTTRGLIAGGRHGDVRMITATGRWDDARPTEGADNACLTFQSSASATLT